MQNVLYKYFIIKYYKDKSFSQSKPSEQNRFQLHAVKSKVHYISVTMNNRVSSPIIVSHKRVKYDKENDLRTCYSSNE